MIIKRNRIRLGVFAMVLLIVLVAGGFALAQDAAEAPVEVSDQEKAAQKLEDVKRNLNTKSDSLINVSRDISIIEEELGNATEEARTLEEQITLLDSEILRTDDQIKRVQAAINGLGVKIAETKEKIAEKTAELAEQKALVQDFMRFLFVQNINIGSFDSSLAQTVKLLFSEGHANDQLTDLYYLELLEVANREMFERLAKLKSELETTQSDLVNQQEDEKDLQKELVKERTVFEIEKKAKVDLLEETKGKEEIYKNLLEQARNEQIEVRSEIADLGDVYEKLNSAVMSKEGFAQEQVGKGITDAKLAWPVTPSLGISAFYKDSSYRAALGVDHNAIDIRATMQTTISAAADGVVYKVKGGSGLDYHYVIIAHKGGIMTLYGHMYDIFVTAGQTVRQGQPIGTTGGLPGSRGAGYLTTGPHLHFEVFDDGRHVDPMYYMDLSGIDARYLPDAYIKL